MTTKKYWYGDEPTVCQLTNRPIKDLFVNGATTDGPWAIMHPNAHVVHGRGLGTGRGQLYQKQPDGKWLKIEG